MEWREKDYGNGFSSLIYYIIEIGHRHLVHLFPTPSFFSRNAMSNQAIAASDAFTSAPHPRRHSRARRFFQGVVLGYFSHIIVISSGIFLTRFWVKELGDHQLGLWLIATQIIAYTSVLDLGLSSLLAREIAAVSGHSKNDPRSLAHTFRQFSALVLAQTPIVALLFALFWLLFPASWAGLKAPIALLFVVFVVLFPARIFQSVLYGLQDHVFLGSLRMSGWALGTVLSVVLVLKGFGLNAMILGWLLTLSMGVIGAGLRLHFRFPGIVSYSLADLRWPVIKRRFQQTIWISAGQTSNALLESSDIAIVGRFVSPEGAVPYAMTSKLASVLTHLPNQLMQVAFPALAQIKAGESRPKVAQVMISLILLLSLESGAIFCVVLAVNRGFVAWWVGDRFYSGMTLTFVFLTEMFLRHCSTALAYSLFSFGREREYTIASLFDGVFSIFLSSMLCWGLGPIGVPLGSMISACIVSFPFTLAIFATELHMSVPTLLRPFAGWAWRLVAFITGLLVLNRYWEPEGFWELAGTSIAVLLAYILTMRPLLFRPPLVQYVPAWLYRFFGRKPPKTVPC